MAASRSKESAASAVGRVLRAIFWALLIAFAVGFLIGSILRRELEKPIRYIGERPPVVSTLALRPRDVGDPAPRVLVPRDHEEQVG